jgi:hypothetical protein
MFILRLVVIVTLSQPNRRVSSGVTGWLERLITSSAAKINCLGRRLRTKVVDPRACSALTRSSPHSKSRQLSQLKIVAGDMRLNK